MENKISKIIVYTYLIAILLIYPLFMHDKYFDISYAKLCFFYIANLLLIIGTMGIVFFYGWNAGNIIKELMFLGLISVSFIIGFLINGHTHDMLVNPMEYDVGLIFMLALILGVLCMLRLDWNYSGIVYSLLIVTGAIISLSISVLQFSGYDVGGLIEDIEFKMQTMFLGTLGNLGYMGLYIVMVFPFSVFLFLQDENVYAIEGCLGLYLCGIGVLISNTDGTLLAFIVTSILLGIITLNESKYRLKLYLILLIIAIAFTTVAIIVLFDNSARVLFNHQAWLTNPFVLALLYLLSVLGIVLDKGEAKFLYDKAIIVALKLSLILLCLIPLLIALYTFFGSSERAFGKILYFDNHWGTDRGYLWKSAVQIFSQGNLGQKLFGQGAGSFARKYIDNYYYSGIELGILENYDAHNIYLQMLCEYGVIATVAAISFFVLRIRKMFSDGSLFLKCKAISLIGAMIASLFLVFQNITLAWITVLI